MISKVNVNNENFNVCYDFISPKNLCIALIVRCNRDSNEIYVFYLIDSMVSNGFLPVTFLRDDVQHS